jgi:hypothetical protein
MGARPLDTDKSDVLSHRSVMSAVRRLYATASMRLDTPVALLPPHRHAAGFA